MKSTRFFYLQKNTLTGKKRPRLAVAVEGSTVIAEDGTEIVIKKSMVGGVLSEGMFCDSRMLGWVGGSEGVAQQIPDTVPIGDRPPSSKPMLPNNESSTTSGVDVLSVEVKPLFEKKLSKEEKKKLSEEKRLAKRATKEK
jgi:hypothetical protein